MSTVFVRKLPYELQNADLEKAFEDIGPIKRGYVIRDKDGSKGFGFVEFASSSDATAAVEFWKDKLLNGRKIAVEIASKEKMNKFTKKSAPPQKEGQAIQHKPKPKPKVDGNKTVVAAPSPTVLIEAISKDSNKSKVAKGGVGATALVVFGIPKGTDKQGLQAWVNAALAKSVGEEKENEEKGKDKKKDKKKEKEKANKEVVKEIVFPSPESTSKELAARLLFHNAGQASLALGTLSKRPINNQPVRVARLTAKSARVIVRNLPFKCTEAELTEHFRAAGKVTQVTLPKHLDGKLKGFAFVEYADHAAADQAIKSLNRTKLRGRKVTVDWAMAKKAFEEAKIAALAAVENGDGEENEKSEDEQGKTIEKEEDASGDEGESGGEGDDDAESDEGDDDDDGEGDDEESDVDVALDDDEVIEPPKPKRPSDVEKGCTVFVRNLSYDTTEEELKRRFEAYGPVKSAKLVMDKDSGKPKGTAFVNFKEKSSADRVLALAVAPAAGSKKQQKKDSKRQQASGISLHGRDLFLSPALPKEAAEKLNTAEEDDKTDKRNIYLAYEGAIMAGSAAAKGLSPDELNKRAAAMREKRTKLKNPNFFVSKVRLSVRNLPLWVDDKTLKGLFLEAAKGKGQVVIKQAKVVRSKERTDAQGRPRSKGYGFVEFSEHEDALRALRELNNNPRAFGSNSPYASVTAAKATSAFGQQQLRDTRRLFIDFALDDQRKLLVKKRRVEKMKNESVNLKAAPPATAPILVPEEDGKKETKKNKKTKTSETSKKTNKIPSPTESTTTKTTTSTTTTTTTTTTATETDGPRVPKTRAEKRKRHKQHLKEKKQQEKQTVLEKEQALKEAQETKLKAKAEQEAEKKVRDKEIAAKNRKAELKDQARKQSRNERRKRQHTQEAEAESAKPDPFEDMVRHYSKKLFNSKGDGADSDDDDDGGKRRKMAPAPVKPRWFDV